MCMFKYILMYKFVYQGWYINMIKKDKNNRYITITQS